MKNCVKLSTSQNWTKSLYPIHVVHYKKKDNDDYFVQFFSCYNKFISEYHREALPSFIFLLKLSMFLSFPWSFCCKTKLVRCWKLWMFLSLQLSFLQHQAFESPRAFNIFPPSLICFAHHFYCSTNLSIIFCF